MTDRYSAALEAAAKECDRLRESYRRSRDLYDENDPQVHLIKYAGAAVAVCGENIRALPVPPPEPARVRKLVWEREIGGTQVAFPGFGMKYRLAHDARSDDWMWFCVGVWYFCRDEDAAKAAAQADFDARIRACLEDGQ